MRYESPDPYSRSNKMSDRDAEPSEVLYIGFPATLKVDEGLLMEVFSPFGDIAKVTIFPGRSYAFVQFRSLMAARKAKETLQGKLFGNPRVHISFAKSEPSSSSSGRGPSGRSIPIKKSIAKVLRQREKLKRFTRIEVHRNLNHCSPERGFARDATFSCIEHTLLYTVLCNGRRV